MPAPARRCADHGAFRGDACPDCGTADEHLLSGGRRTRLSKFVSGALRHFPDDAGIHLDERGWTTWVDLVTAVAGRYDWADEAALEAVVATDPKSRFERADGRVRAAYGHSVDVDLADADTPVPDTLYHGTAPRNVEDILADGLQPMARQQVRLSGSVEEATAVGVRHGDEAVVLAVDTAAMEDGGHRIVRRGRGVYTTDRVPPKYVDVQDGGA